MTEEISEDIRRRALALQAVGPDEYPFGYYIYLARLEAGEVEI